MDDPRRNLRMIPSSNIISFSDYQHHQSVEMLDHDQDSSLDSHLNSLMCSLSLLKEKVNQVHSIATSSSSSFSSSSSSSSSLPGMTTLIQEIIVTASNMMFNCQQMALASSPAAATATTGNSNTLPVIYEYDHLQDGTQFHGCNNKLYNSDTSGKKSINDDDQCNINGLDNVESRGSDHHQGQARPNFIASDHQEPSFYWYNDAYNNSTNNSTNCTNNVSNGTNNNTMMTEGPENYDIIEIDAAELLAKYTHYCQVCGKGFKRDANLRMHMRAHGDEYKSSAALSNPLKNNKEMSSENVSTTSQVARKYSCPQEGCRWNRKHAKFQPLKSMICVKNHYKRTHCPKMYVCNRCNRKQFSVLSDLRTHEKHCGDLRWRCSCGTTFSRKDKLMGHVALFVGHSPVGLPAGSSSLATAK